MSTSVPGSGLSRPFQDWVFGRVIDPATSLAPAELMVGGAQATMRLLPVAGSPNMTLR